MHEIAHANVLFSVQRDATQTHVFCFSLVSREMNTNEETILRVISLPFQLRMKYVNCQATCLSSEV